MITKDMTIQEVVAKYPKMVSIFERYGLGCCGCLAAEFENLESGAIVHGIKVEDLLMDLNAQRLLES
jgi:hybrid cluster-associated redox disulfide protein